MRNGGYNKRLAKNLGYHLSSEFDKAEKSGRINIHEGDMKDHVERLTMKRTDGVIGNVHEVKFIIKEFYPTFEIVTLPKPVRSPTGAYLIFSKAAKIKDKDVLMKKISKALTLMQQDGTYTRINDKYLKP